MQNEIILYQNNEVSTKIEVRIEDETVWLNRQQLATLFNRDVKTIGKHIKNILQEELNNISVVANFATTGSDGKIYNVEYYNLDMIISIGYRVKSKQGIQFRIWANKVLKDYLLKGFVINQRLEQLEGDVRSMKKDINQFNFQLSSTIIPNEGIFFDGQIFDAYVFVSKIIKSAKKSIILIDNYIDESVLILLNKKRSNIKTVIFTSKITPELKLDLKKFNLQYSPIEIKTYTNSHDRFLIIDEGIIYHIGASLKDLGKKWFAFSRIDINPNLILEKLK